jgi:predicted nucleic acid-binding protein
VHDFYWDASALVKRYTLETGIPFVNHLFAHVTSDRMMCLIVGIGEVISILVRKKNASLITDNAFTQALADFRAEVIDAAAFNLVSVEDALVLASHSLIVRHSLNATDAFLLQSILDAASMVQPAGNDIVLVVSDRRLLRAAQAEGLQTFNPEIDSQVYLDALIQADHGEETT